MYIYIYIHLYIYLYIYLYYRYVRSEIQKWCTCRCLGTISVRTYRYFHSIPICVFNNFLNRINVNDHLPLRYQHEFQCTKTLHSIFLFIQKYRYVHFWDKNIHYILHHFEACRSTVEMSIFIYIVRNIIWDCIRFIKIFWVYLKYLLVRIDIHSYFCTCQ